MRAVIVELLQRNTHQTYTHNLQSHFNDELFLSKVDVRDFYDAREKGMGNTMNLRTLKYILKCMEISKCSSFYEFYPSLGFGK